MRNIRARARDAILGTIVADAASLGLHWVYDVDEVARLGGGAPEFHSPEGREFHTARRVGQLTHYGEHAVLVLESLAATGGFDADDYRRRLIEHFGAADYDGYIDHATQDLLATKRGADDNQAGAFVKLAPLVARYLNGGEDPLEDAIRVTHDNTQAVRYALAASEAIGAAIIGATPKEVVQVVSGGSGAPAALAKRALQADPDPIAFALKTGQTCPVPNALPVALHATLHTADFKDMVRKSILSGGDSSGRLFVSAAIIGAHAGVPADWLERLDSVGRIAELTETVLDQAGVGV